MTQPQTIHPGHSHGADNAPGPPADAPRDPRQDVQTLKGIVSDIEQFVERWMPRFDQMLAQCSAAPQRHQDEPPPEDLDEQRREWQQQRRLEAQRLKEQADQLTEAWIRLERQQRAVLQAQAAWQQRRGVPACDPSLRDASTGSDTSDRPASAGTEITGAHCGLGTASADSTRLSSRLSQQTPADQLELLRHALGDSSQG